METLRNRVKVQITHVKWPWARASVSTHSSQLNGSQSHRKKFHVFVPSHRKVEGHVRYRLEVRASVVTNTLLNNECEKRLSEIRNFRNKVEQIMGTRNYSSLIKAKFPGGGLMGTSARLEIWFNEVVSQCDKPQFRELLSALFGFLRIRDLFNNEESNSTTPAAEPATLRPSNEAFSPFKLFRNLTAKSDADVSCSSQQKEIEFTPNLRRIYIYITHSILVCFCCYYNFSFLVSTYKSLAILLCFPRPPLSNHRSLFLSSSSCPTRGYDLRHSVAPIMRSTRSSSLAQ